MQKTRFADRWLLLGLFLGLVAGVVTIAAMIVVTVLVLYPGDVSQKVKQIELGMTEADVKASLGEPTHEYAHPSGNCLLLYPDGFHDPLCIELDKEDKVVDLPW